MRLEQEKESLCAISPRAFLVLASPLKFILLLASLKDYVWRVEDLGPFFISRRAVISDKTLM